MQFDFILWRDNEVDALIIEAANFSASDSFVRPTLDKKSVFDRLVLFPGIYYTDLADNNNTFKILYPVNRLAFFSTDPSWSWDDFRELCVICRYIEKRATIL